MATPSSTLRRRGRGRSAGGQHLLRLPRARARHHRPGRGRRRAHGALRRRPRRLRRAAQRRAARHRLRASGSSRASSTILRTATGTQRVRRGLGYAVANARRFEGLDPCPSAIPEVDGNDRLPAENWRPRIRDHGSGPWQGSTRCRPKSPLPGRSGRGKRGPRRPAPEFPWLSDDHHPAPTTLATWRRRGSSSGERGHRGPPGWSATRPARLLRVPLASPLRPERGHRLDARLGHRLLRTRWTSSFAARAASGGGSSRRDQSVYLHPDALSGCRARRAWWSGEHDFPDVVVEVDHTTDVRRGKLWRRTRSGAFPRCAARGS